jgi:dephospho-CoA kinase
MEEFILIYIDAPAELRHKRVTARGQNAGDTDKSFEEFLKDEEHDTERSIRSLRPLANTVIENIGSEADIEEALISYLKQYIVD